MMKPLLLGLAAAALLALVIGVAAGWPAVGHFMTGIWNVISG